MPHTFFAHTRDLGVRLNGGSLGEVIASAAAAFLEAVTDPRRRIFCSGTSWPSCYSTSTDAVGCCAQV
jgi:hypothetical protein